MIHETGLEPRLLDWLRDAPAGASGWVLDAVADHAHAHPRRRSLRVRWSDAMDAMPLVHPATPAMRFALVVVLAVLGLTVGGLFYAGSHGPIVGPSPGPSATPVPSPSPTDPSVVIDDNLRAWRDDDVAAIPRLYTADHTLHFFGDPSGLGGADYFTYREMNGGWVTWARRGPVFHGGAYWTHATEAGVFTPLSLGFVVYRFDRQSRIEAQWVIMSRGATADDPTFAQMTDAAVKAELQRLVDRCSRALDARDRAALATCYAPDAAWSVSADDPEGDWTDQAAGLAAIEAGLDRSVYGGIVRTGDVVWTSGLMAYPFRGTASGACAAGIGVLRLDRDLRIRDQWVFCGPE